jgi:protein O-mannosyl-transferase
LAVTSITTKKAIYLLILLGLLVYLNCLFNPFIGDDFGQIINNPFVHSLKNIPKLFVGSTFYLKTTDSLSGNYYKPLMSVIFTFLYSFAGAHSFFYHLLQVFLHLANAILIFLFFHHFFQPKISLILSLIFLVHPLNTEAVIYISGLQDTLFLFFGMLALNLLTAKTISVRRLIIINLCLFLSLLSKESGLLFVFILSLYGYFFTRKKFWPYALSFFGTFLLYLVIRFAAVGFTFNSIKVSPIMTVSLLTRLVNLPAIIFFYFKTFIFPLRLIILQNWLISQLNFSNFYVPLIILSFIILLLFLLGYHIYFRKPKLFPLFLFFSFWLIIGLGFHAQIFPLDLTVSDRWFYFPEIGLLALFGFMLTVVPQTSRLARSILTLLAGRDYPGLVHQNYS